MTLPYHDYIVDCTAVLLARVNMWTGDKIARVTVSDEVLIRDYGYFEDTGHEYEIDDSSLYKVKTSYDIDRVKVVRPTNNFIARGYVDILEIFDVTVTDIDWDSRKDIDNSDV